VEDAAMNLEKVRQHFENAPYPRIPLEASPKNNLDTLYVHNILTPFYLRNQQVLDIKETVILDAGCGSGYTSLIMAESNPGAKIVGIDISEQSVKLARERLQYHGFENVEFHAIPIEELPSLGLEFDYINSDEVLYLIPDPLAGLKAMQSVLKPGGILRTNLHSSLQRAFYYRAQEVFRMMGLMDGSVEELEVELLREMMRSLDDQTYLKVLLWKPVFETDEEAVRANLLLQGDKGFTVPEMFALLEATNLEFFSMVQWRQWDLMSLFKNPADLPPFLAMSLPEATVEDHLHLFELLQPIHRLLDFWCGHPNQARSFTPVSEWDEADWHRARVHLHPQLQAPQVKADLLECIRTQRSFDFSRHISAPTTKAIVVESDQAACLLPLWEGVQTVTALADRWQKLRPVDCLTLGPVDARLAFEQVQRLLVRLEVFLYVLLEQPL